MIDTFYLQLSYGLLQGIDSEIGKLLRWRITCNYDIENVAPFFWFLKIFIEDRILKFCSQLLLHRRVGDLGIRSNLSFFFQKSFKNCSTIFQKLFKNLSKTFQKLTHFDVAVFWVSSFEAIKSNELFWDQNNVLSAACRRFFFVFGEEEFGKGEIV